MCNISIIHSSVIGCFHFLTDENNIKINIAEQVSVGYDTESFGHIFNSSTMASCGRSISSF